MVSGSKDEIIIKENIIRNIEKIKIINALLVISLLMVLLKIVTSSFPKIVAINEIIIIDKVPIFIPPATDNELPPTNIKAKVDMVVLL